MWLAHHQSLGEYTTKTTLSHDALPLSFGDVIQLWKSNDGFNRFFTATLSQSDYSAFFWETPPITRNNLALDFECVLVSAPELSRLRADPAAFSKHFLSPPADQIVTFSNLGGDATLVVPVALRDDSPYSHLAQFLKNAPVGQASSLWRNVALALNARISDAPIWLSTAGMGVPWLHIRLDSTPKYYRHSSYKKN